MKCSICGRELAYVGATCSVCGSPGASNGSEKQEPMNWDRILERVAVAVAEFERMWK